MHLYKFLSSFGYEKCEAHPSLNLFQKRENLVFQVIYLDEVLLIGSEREAVERRIVEFRNASEMRVFAKIEVFLEFSVDNSGSGIKIHNKDMTEKILNYFNLESYRPFITPLPHGIDLS